LEAVNPTGRLLYYLYGLVGTLHFTCAANQACIQVDYFGFSVNDFEHADRARVFAGSAAITFVVFYFYFNHVAGISPLRESHQSKHGTIKTYLS
jgi:hypothetical protein